MPSLRAPGRSPVYRAIAHVLIAALIAAAIPTAASASIPEAEAERLTKTAFGELIAHTGTDPQPYAFAGEPYDPNSGFQYHRARWMDPRSGRFLGMDPFVGFRFDPGTLHRYVYAESDPIGRRDPTGKLSSGETIGVLTITVVLDSFLLIAALAAVAYELTPGVTALREFDIDIMKNFNTRNRRRDPWQGHEMLQNAWLIANGFTRVRNQGVASQENPAIAVSVSTHIAIGIGQRLAGLHDASQLAQMSGEENIAKNGVIAMACGVWAHVVGQAMMLSEMHLMRIREMRANGLPTW